MQFFSSHCAFKSIPCFDMVISYSEVFQLTVSFVIFLWLPHRYPYQKTFYCTRFPLMMDLIPMIMDLVLLISPFIKIISMGRCYQGILHEWGNSSWYKTTIGIPSFFTHFECFSSIAMVVVVHAVHTVVYEVCEALPPKWTNCKHRIDIYGYQTSGVLSTLCLLNDPIIPLVNQMVLNSPVLR